MYVVKNAWKSIVRSKGRNILIGIIVLAIAVSACLGLSIREAAKQAKESAFENVAITAQISVDRTTLMNSQKGNKTQGGGFNRQDFVANMQNVNELTVDEMLKYAQSQTVKDFYYTLTVSMNGSDELVAVNNRNTGEQSGDDGATNGNGSNNSSGATSTGGVIQSLEGAQGSSGGAMTPGMGNMSGNMGGAPEGMGNMPGGMGGNKGFIMGTMGTQGDFTVVGYSADAAMTDFVNAICVITEGKVFEEGLANNECIISEELATYNDIVVGDTLTIVNPNDEEESYELTVVGIYANSQSSVTQGNMMAGFSTATDSANQIYTSYATLKTIVDKSAANATTSTDENTGRDMTTAIPEQVSGTYVFATVEDYEAFAQEVYDLGLSDNYTVSSADVSSFQQSIVPLNNLSQMALYFLLVVLAIGAVVLVVLNIFSVRERKYEVGVLTAIGMKKVKVSIQFVLESLIVTVVAVVLGAIIGTVSSVPVTNALLKTQIEAQAQQEQGQEEAFGRVPGNNMEGKGQGGNGNMNVPNIQDKDIGKALGQKTVDYVSQVSSATNLTVLMQLLVIGILLALVASVASIVFIMRYDPLKILSNRD